MNNISANTRLCIACNIKKPLSEFHKNGRGGYKSHCKSCRSIIRKSYSNGRVGRQAEAEAHLKARYGITGAEWKELFDLQGGECAICKEHTETFHVDHCHETGKVRGLLCRACNIGLGHFRDNIVLLRQAAEYLGE